MKKIMLTLALVANAGCISKGKGVNSEYSIYPSPPAPVGNIHGPDSADLLAQGQSMASRSAIEGKVLLMGDIPLPLSRVNLALYRKVFSPERWIEVTRITSSNDGGFRITQKLNPGEYELRTDDARFQGIQSVTLQDSPVHNVFVQVTRK